MLLFFRHLILASPEQLVHHVVTLDKRRDLGRTNELAIGGSDIVGDGLLVID
jgi:hypothetical protein